MATELLIEKIQHRAYEMWLSEGGPLGRDAVHWARAEAEFREQFAGRNASARTGFHEKAAVQDAEIGRRLKRKKTRLEEREL